MRTCSCPTLLLAAAALLLAGCATISAPLPAAAPPVPPPAAPAPSAPQLSYFEQQQQALETQLAADLRQGAVELDSPQANELDITLPTDASFADNSAQLRPAAQAVLARIATVLRRFDHTTLTITGYSDRSGNPALAQQLSDARAHQILQDLALQGIAAARMQAIGRGEQNPRASNHTEFGRALNRRIQIVILPAGAG